MTVGALIDAGADTGTLFAGLDSLGTGAKFRAEKVKRRGIAATFFHVEAEDTKSHRHLPQITRMIDGASLPDAVKQNAHRVFDVLARAESSVHGVPMEKVHFHEVGAVDSICDIAGICFALHLVGVDTIYASAVNTGSGTVNTQHGVLPVPAPATARLLEGIPVYARGPALELTTPTGAAFLKALASGFGALPPMTIARSGFGAGSKDFPEHANVLRVMLGEPSGASEAVEIRILEANIDDSTPQVLGYALERLLEAGALDVTLQPVTMKKQRPGTLVQVLAKPEDQEKLSALLLRETSTLGIRITRAERRVASRQHVEVATKFGAVRIKVSGEGHWSPEYEDCRQLAIETGAALREIIAEAGFAYRKSLE